LNEEAGRLLLEKYDDYARHAKLYTDIHARATRQTSEDSVPETNSNPPTTKKRTAGTRGAKKEGEKKKTDQKKKSLKRL